MDKESPVYWTNPLQESFEIEIKSCNKNDDHYEVEIDIDCIRPSGGGQAGDRGWLKTKGVEGRIVDTITRDDLTKLVSDCSFSGESKGVLTIDVAWRRAMMRNHTGEHLLAGALVRSIEGIQLGYIWIDGEHGTIELEGKAIPTEDILKAESEVQRSIAQGVAVVTAIIDASKVAPNVRAREGATEKHTTLRTVSIEGFDSSACSGTHVINTSDIGLFKIIDIKHGESSTHIEFITGNKAVHEVSNLYNEAFVRKDEYPFEMEQLGSVLDKGRKAQEERKHLQESIERLVTVGWDSERLGEISFRHHWIPGLNSHGLRSIIKKLESKDPTAVLLFVPGKKCHVVLWTNNLEGSAQEYIGNLVVSHGGRGGGSKTVYTGGFTEVESHRDLYAALVNGVRARLSTG